MNAQDLDLNSTTAKNFEVATSTERSGDQTANNAANAANAAASSSHIKSSSSHGRNSSQRGSQRRMPRNSAHGSPKDGERKGSVWGKARGSNNNGASSRRSSQGYGQGAGAVNSKSRTANQPRNPRDKLRAEGFGPNRKIIDVRNVFPTKPALGRMVELPICEITDKGAFVDAGEFGPLFVPQSQLSLDIAKGDLVNVFLYQDRHRVLATCKHPYLELGQVGMLRVKSIETGTAYLDLGIPKDLILPRPECRHHLKEGDVTTVLMAIDVQGRLFATHLFNSYIRDCAREGEFAPTKRVKAVIIAKTPLGYSAIVEDKVWALLLASEMLPQERAEIVLGKRITAYVRSVLPDGKINITLHEIGEASVEHAAFEILQALYREDGHINFNDKSDKDAIEAQFKISKLRFKKGISYLYSRGLVNPTDTGLDLTDVGRAFIDRCVQESSQDYLAEAASTVSAMDGTVVGIDFDLNFKQQFGAAKESAMSTDEAIAASTMTSDLDLDQSGFGNFGTFGSYVDYSEGVSTDSDVSDSFLPSTNIVQPLGRRARKAQDTLFKLPQGLCLKYLRQLDKVTTPKKMAVLAEGKESVDASSASTTAPSESSKAKGKAQSKGRGHLCRNQAQSHGQSQSHGHNKAKQGRTPALAAVSNRADNRGHLQLQSVASIVAEAVSEVKAPVDTDVSTDAPENS